MCQLRSLLAHARLFVYDYDLTLARTDRESPGGLTVTKAYALALDDIFGVSGLLGAIGGLRNRAPAELALHVLQQYPQLIWTARAYYRRNRHQLVNLVPKGKGIDLASAHIGHNEVDFCAELIVRAKLALLHAEQGTHPSGVWPAPCEGVPTFFNAYADRTHAIISSGHDMFIARSFELWQVPCPKLIVTDDDLRGLGLPVEEKTKPNSFLVELLLSRAALRGLSFERDQIVYFGDDLNKDGKLAANAGIGFLWYNPDGKKQTGAPVAEFAHWDEVADALVG